MNDEKHWVKCENHYCEIEYNANKFRHCPICFEVDK